MLDDNQIIREGRDALIKQLGLVGAERFLVLVNRDAFDYTEWRKHLFETESLEELSKMAKEFSDNN